MEAEIAEQVKRSNVNDFESILDKFIRENPRISRGKAEFYNPVNMAKQSVEDNDELVTETLANVYYKQGHYKKAIRAYEKLCLIYPHKMTYFASLIQKIKTETKE
ncbi:MAG: tetratricopeptide repeat protein [Bacteroidota bacterium]